MKATSSTGYTSGAPSNSRAIRRFDHQPLGRVVFGLGELSRIGELAPSLYANRVILVTDPGVAQAGHSSRAERSMLDAGLEVHTFDGVKENPTEHEVAKGVRFARERNVDLIVAIGGGSSMDCAKGINFLLTNGGRMADYRGYGKAKAPMLPSIGVPTTTGTGSEAQSYALITDSSSHLKMACGDKKAAFRISILDPELTLSQPRAVKAATGIDAVAHAIESFVSTARNEISMTAARTAWRRLEANFEASMGEDRDLEVFAAMQLGAHFAGTAIENSMLGVCHSCANPLTAHYGITHGMAVGVMLPHVIRFNASVVDDLYGELVSEYSELNGRGAGELLSERVSELLRAAGMPTTLRECEVSESILPLLAEEASHQWTAQFNPRPVEEIDIVKLYFDAW